jgi:hypothetical protein
MPILFLISALSVCTTACSAVTITSAPTAATVNFTLTCETCDMFTCTRPQLATAEQPISKTKEEIIKEAKRVEEALLYSSKGQFAASHFWSTFHLWIGIPMVVISGVAGASALASFDKDHLIAEVLSIIVAAPSGVMTFLNPHEKTAAHLNAGNHYDSLMNQVRIFWSIDCWRDESEQVLGEKLLLEAER